MVEIRCIEKEDIDNLSYRKLDWDVNINGVPYQVIKAAGYAHTIGGRLDWGDGNCLYAYPLGEKMTYENLTPFDGHPGARWGLIYNQTNTFNSHYGDSYIDARRKLTITRNDEEFYSGLMTFNEAVSYIFDGKLDEHPLDLNERDFDKKCIGRKIFYRSQPAKIESYVKRQACVIVVPDGFDSFETPNEFKSEPVIDYEEGKSVKISIFDPHIYWFRK